MPTQAAAQGFELVSQGVRGLGFTDGELGQGGAGTFLGCVARGFDGAFELCA